MADVVVNTETNNPKELLGQGIRAFVLQDYDNAIAALSKACELLQTEHGDELHDSLADVYLYYGKALLGLSRDESEPLGDAVPKNEESDEDEGVETEDGDEKEDEVGETAGTETESAENKENDSAEKNENGTIQEEKTAENGTTSGTQEGSSAADVDTAEDKTEDDEPSDLQVAWEVLELAKKIYQRHGDNGKKNFAETLIVLGEISLESENFDAAVNDIKEGLEIQKTLFGKDSRTLAETYYKLGVAYSTNSQIEDAITSFKGALEYLNNRVVALEKEEKKAEIEEEIKEIKGLIPDIEEKIADMKTYKDEALKKLVSAVSNQISEGGSGATSSSSSAAPANNISHLVKRKRKIDDVFEKNDQVEESPAKKPAV